MLAETLWHQPSHLVEILGKLPLPLPLPLKVLLFQEMSNLVQLKWSAELNYFRRIETSQAICYRRHFVRG
nr:hypothetical protein Iba_chr01cCG8500 [Ipomoea batatas]